jgi:hypothetical protein
MLEGEKATISIIFIIFNHISIYIYICIYIYIYNMYIYIYIYPYKLFPSLQSAMHAGSKALGIPSC